MPRPKGCRCPKPDCPIHPGRWADSGERAQDGQQPPDTPEPGSTDARPFLRVIEGAERDHRDPPPKPRKPPAPPSPSGPTDVELTKMLAELLTFPAIPAAMVLECDFCRDHFITEGPRTARELVALAQTNPALRGALESVYGAWTKVTVGAVLAGYALKPLAHHLAPNRVLEQVGPVVGVPARPEEAKHHHHAADPQAGHNGSPPADTGHAPANQPAGDQAA